MSKQVRDKGSKSEKDMPWLSDKAVDKAYILLIKYNKKKKKSE